MNPNSTIMRLKIAPNRYISEVQKEFNAEFPYLKLSFFGQNSNSSHRFSSHQMITGDKKLGDSFKKLSANIIQIEENMKVKEVEKVFKDKCNLHVKIFRKSGNLWLETTMTDNWSLLQQNNHGREISSAQQDD